MIRCTLTVGLLPLLHTSTDQSKSSMGEQGGDATVSLRVYNVSQLSMRIMQINGRGLGRQNSPGWEAPLGGNFGNYRQINLFVHDNIEVLENLTPFPKNKHFFSSPGKT